MLDYSVSPDGLAITCRRCGATSRNECDIRHRYCSACHRYHDLSHLEPSEILALLKIGLENDSVAA